MDNCTPYCIYLHTTNIRVTGVVYSNVSGRWYAQMYNNLKLFDYGEKIYFNRIYNRLLLNIL